MADTSEVQARKQDARIKPIGELPTPGNVGNQSTIPVFYGGHPYIFNFSEYAALGQPCASRPDRETNFGYPRSSTSPTRRIRRSLEDLQTR